MRRNVGCGRACVNNGSALARRGESAWHACNRLELYAAKRKKNLWSARAFDALVSPFPSFCLAGNSPHENALRFRRRYTEFHGSSLILTFPA